MYLKFSRLIFVAALLLTIVAADCKDETFPPSDNRKPNIIILLADQLRAQALGYAGDENVITPHIDSLAAHSANFQYAISNLPVCTPYRASLLTGQRPLTNGIFMNDVRLDTAAVTLAEVLAKNGYNTGYIGKWHLDGQYRLAFTPPGPRRQGFQYWKAVNCSHNYNRSAYYLNDDTTRRYWEGYDAIAQTKDAEDYIQGHASGSQPFFLMLSWGTPHSPYPTAPEKYKSMYDPETIALRPNVPEQLHAKAQKDLAGYYAHITALDDMVASLISRLKAEGILDNTIILFTSDHGDLMGSHAHYAKQRPYDESIRVPFLVYDGRKAGIRPGRYDAMIGADDIMPTLLGLAGVGIPQSVDGVSFAKYLRGRKTSPKDSLALFYCIQPFGQWTRKQGGKEIRGIRTPRYTYVRDLNGPWLLYDNGSDPYQQHNLVDLPEHASLQSRLDRLLLKRLNETGDEFLSGDAYLKKYQYPPLDKTGTVPYYNR